MFGNNTTVSNFTCPEGGYVNTYRQVLGTIIFVIVWPFIVLDIKFLPLGRAAAAMVGATLMVVFNVVPQDQAYDTIGDEPNVQTILLLIGMMLMAYYYDREGLLQKIALWIFGKNKPFREILWKVSLLSAFLSAIITNDATCLVITPLVLFEHRHQNRDSKEVLPLLLGIATSANIGSASTYFGNPQNAYIAASSNNQISLLVFFETSLPAAALGMAINIGLLYLLFMRTIFFNKNTNVTNHTELHDEGAELTMSVTSLPESRRNLAIAHDQSDNPLYSSRIALERRRYRTAPARHYRYSKNGDRFAQSHSSRANLKGDQITYTKFETDASLTESNAPQEHVEENLDNELENEEKDREVVITQRLWDRTWRQKAFIVWLVFITVLLLILLAIPPNILYFNAGLVPMGAGISTMLVDSIINRKYAYDAMTKIDWTVLMLFMGLFVWLQGIKNTCFPYLIFVKLLDNMDLCTVGGVLVFTIFVIIGSNILSNVPLVVLIAGYLSNFPCQSLVGENSSNEIIRIAGIILAWVSTIAGNFTLIGSVANLIVAEKARSCIDYKLTFWEYIKFGFVSTLMVMFTGLPVVYFIGRVI